MKEWIDFLSQPTGIGIATLAILGVIYLIKEFIAFLQNNVLPELFKWRLEKRKLILPFAKKVLDRDWKDPAFFRPGLPKYIDFEEGYLLIRPEVDLIKSKLKNHRFVHIEGHPSSGKSIIALTIAYQQLKAKKTAIYFNRPTSIPESLFDNSVAYTPLI